VYALYDIKILHPEISYYPCIYKYMAFRDPWATPASHVRASVMFILVFRRIGNQKARRWVGLRWSIHHTNFLENLYV
jgi:hypothetical protein